MRLRVGSVALAAVLIASGCTAEDVPPTVLTSDPATSSQVSTTPSSPLPTASSAPPSTSAASPTEQPIIAQWQKYWDVMYSLQGESVVKQTDALTKVATGRRTTKSAKFLQAQAGEGKRETGSFNFNQADVKVQGSKATVVECRDESKLTVVVVATGEVISTGHPRNKLTGTMVLTADGVWKLDLYDSKNDAC